MADSVKFKQDVIQMKEWVTNLKNYDNKEVVLSEIEKLLVEYDTDTFYIIKDDNKLIPSDVKSGNYLLVTHSEIMAAITTGIDIDKISYSGGKFPSITAKPLYYRQVQGNTKFLLELCHRYKNFRYVDGKLLKYALINMYFNK